MRVGIVAPPFIPVPPKTYGGTELFVATLAEALVQEGIEAVVYANGESTVRVEKKYLYSKAEWPVNQIIYQGLKELHHTCWSIRDASLDCDVIHLNGAAGVSLSQLTDRPVVTTLHHPHSEVFRDHYLLNSSVSYATLSRFQQNRNEPLKSMVIYHGVDMSAHRFGKGDGGYLCWLGRLSEVKGAHRAIECAKRLGIPLKFGGDVQPVNQAYFDAMVKPHIDGSFIEYLGELNIEEKNELYGRALAFLFPISWEEPFGLVTIEAMACGTPVLALRGGSVEEIVTDGLSGYVCDSVEQMVKRYPLIAQMDRLVIRKYAEERFSAARMAQEYIALYQSLLTSSRIHHLESTSYSLASIPDV